MSIILLIFKFLFSERHLYNTYLNEPYKFCLQHAMFVYGGSACYLTHLSHDQRDMTQSSSTLAALEVTIITGISETLEVIL